MKHQFTLDSRTEFQTMLQNLLDSAQRYDLDIRISKLRIFCAAIKAAYIASPEDLYDILKDMPPLRGLKEDRKDSKSINHHVVFLFPDQLDFVKVAMGRLNIAILGPLSRKENKNLRMNERGFLHLCLYYYASLDKQNKIIAIKTSDDVHSFEAKKRRPKGYRNMPEYNTDPDK